MASGSLMQLTASKAGSSGTSRNWKPLLGGGEVNSGGRYYPAGNSRLEVPCHAYGKGRASSFGSIHEDWKAAGPNLAPYPGSSGMMTGGAPANRQIAGGAPANRQIAGGAKKRRHKTHKKVRKTKKTKKSMRGGSDANLILLHNGNKFASISRISLWKPPGPSFHEFIFIKALALEKEIKKENNTEKKNDLTIQLEQYESLDDAISDVREGHTRTVDITNSSVYTQIILKLKNFGKDVITTEKYIFSHNVESTNV